VKFPALVFEIWCSQGLPDAQTHSLTDSNGRTHPESRTQVFVQASAVDTEVLEQLTFVILKSPY